MRRKAPFCKLRGLDRRRTHSNCESDFQGGWDLMLSQPAIASLSEITYPTFKNTYLWLFFSWIVSRNRDIYCSWMNSASPCCVVGISSAALPPCRIFLTGCRCRPEAANSFQTRPHQWCSSSSWRCVWAGFGLEGFASGSCRQWPWPAAQEHDLSVKNKQTFRRSWVNVVVKHERRGLNRC